MLTTDFPLSEPPCPLAYWSSGFKIPRSSGMPERSWGSYLPGDEPHWRCAETEEPCQSDLCPYKEEETNHVRV